MESQIVTQAFRLRNNHVHNDFPLPRHIREYLLALLFVQDGKEDIVKL